MSNEDNSSVVPSLRDCTSRVSSGVVATPSPGVPSWRRTWDEQFDFEVGFACAFVLALAAEVALGASIFWLLKVTGQ